MNLESIGGDLGLYVGTFVVCFVAGLVPIVNTELYLVAVGLVVASPAPLPAVVLLAAAGEMAAKLLIYYGAAGAASVPTGRAKARIDRAREKVSHWKQRPRWVLWVSSTVGLPPFYAVSLLAGALEIRARTFCAIGMAGRTLRFAVLVAIPWFAS